MVARGKIPRFFWRIEKKTSKQTYLEIFSYIFISPYKSNWFFKALLVCMSLVHLYSLHFLKILLGECRSI